MANFVVARGVGRLGKEGIEKVVGECRSVSGGKALISELLSPYMGVQLADGQKWPERVFCRLWWIEQLLSMSVNR